MATALYVDNKIIHDDKFIILFINDKTLLEQLKFLLITNDKDILNILSNFGIKRQYKRGIHTIISNTFTSYHLSNSIGLDIDMMTYNAIQLYFSFIADSNTLPDFFLDDNKNVMMLPNDAEIERIEYKNVVETIRAKNNNVDGKVIEPIQLHKNYANREQLEDALNFRRLIRTTFGKYTHANINMYRGFLINLLDTHNIVHCSMLNNYTNDKNTFSISRYYHREELINQLHNSLKIK